jgi:hypothetical protein
MTLETSLFLEPRGSPRFLTISVHIRDEALVRVPCVGVCGRSAFAVPLDQNLTWAETHDPPPEIRLWAFGFAAHVSSELHGELSN